MLKGNQLISSLVALLSCGALGTGLSALTGCGSSAPASPTRSEPKVNAKPVRVHRVGESLQERVISAVGSLAGYDQATLSTKVAGRLQSFSVDLGDGVQKGQLLAQIEPQDYKLRVQQAEALLGQARVRLGLSLEGTDDQIEAEKISLVRQARAVLDEASANRKRVVELTEQGISSKSELDTAQAAYQVALSRYEDALEEARMRQAVVAQRRAELELVRQQLVDTAIHAPFEGAIQERRANVGENLLANAPLITLVRVDPLRLRLDVPERESAGVRIGQKVTLTLEGSTNLYSGHVKRLSPALDEQTRMLRVEADVRNPGSLRPGAFARADIVVDGASPTVSVPPSAIITFAGIEKVFVVQENKALEKQITTGRRKSQSIEVLHGLKSGEVIVIEPGSLQTGQAVTILN